MSAIVESLKETAERLISTADVIDKEVRSLGLQNEQWFIDWQDKLNKITVR